MAGIRSEALDRGSMTPLSLPPGVNLAALTRERAGEITGVHAAPSLTGELNAGRKCTLHTLHIARVMNALQRTVNVITCAWSRKRKRA